MDIKRFLSTYPIVKRAKHLSCGLIAEVKQPEHVGEDWQKAMYQQMADFVWTNDKEIIYAIYFYKNNDEQFVLEGTLKSKPSDYTDGMPTSYSGITDVFGGFTRFDFDCLTLADRNDIESILFRMDPTSPNQNPPNTMLKELDLQGFQFAISAKAEKIGADNSIFKVNVAAKSSGEF